MEEIKLTKNVNIFEIDGLNVYYGTHKALENVSIDIEKNSILSLVGPSGCGKTTFLRSLNRMNDLIDGARVDGKMLFEGSDVYKEIDTLVLRKKVGMLFQKPNPFPMSIFDNVAYGIRLHSRLSKAELADRVENSLIKASLFDEVKDRLKSSALQLSGGQQQRLCLARTLAVEPEVILMDEPTSALDPISRAKIEHLMLELKKNYTIVIVTHNMAEAKLISDKIAFFFVDENRTGYLVETGNTKEFFASPKSKIAEDYILGFSA